MDKINLNITTNEDGFEKLSEEEVGTLITTIITDILDTKPGETTPGQLKLESLNELAKKLCGEIGISTIETVCAYIDYIVSKAVKK